MSGKRRRDCQVDPERKSVIGSGARSGAVDAPAAWNPDGTWTTRRAVDVQAHVTELFGNTEAQLLWPCFQQLHRGTVQKLVSKWRGAIPPSGTSLEDLKRVTFELLCFEIEDDDRRELALAQCHVLGLTDDEIRQCESFADALERAKGALDAFRRDVQALIGDVRNRTQEVVANAAGPRTVPAPEQFDEELVLKLRDILRSIRLQNFSRRTTSADLAARGVLILSCECVEWYWELVNAKLVEAGFARFDSPNALYWYLSDACRCESMHVHLLEFVIALCRFGEDRGEQMLLYLRQALIDQLHDSQECYVELRADIFAFARKLRLLRQLHALNPEAVADLEICCGTVFWFDEHVVVRPTVKFSIAQVLETERAATLLPGAPPSFETALTTLFANALFSWLQQYFAAYGEGPWKSEFEAKWGSDPAGFRKTVYDALLGRQSVALWHGLPLRVWLADKDGAVVHEFFRRRQVNIEALVDSMEHKKVIQVVG